MIIQYIRTGLLIYLAAVNLITFAAYGIDKRKAEKDKMRISENKLFIMAGIGGSAGAFLGMMLFHHKTKKPEFRVGILLMLIFHAVLLAVSLF